MEQTMEGTVAVGSGSGPRAGDTKRAPRPLDLRAATAVLDTFLARRKGATSRTYAACLADFARFLGFADAAEGVLRLLSEGAEHPGRANELAVRYKADLVGRRLSPATLNLRIAALRSLVAHARRLGYVRWTLEVDGEHRDGVRDCRGPNVQSVTLLIGSCAQGDALSVRDRGILRLAFDLALRRGEIAALEAMDVDLDRRFVAVLGKGKGGRTWIKLPDPTVEALRAWLSVRGAGPGPLFVRLDPAGGSLDLHSRARLTGEAIRRMVARRARQAGIVGPVRPHGLRHAAITVALQNTRDLRKVQAFSRHSNLRTLQVYDDAREGLDGLAADGVAAAV